MFISKKHLSRRTLLRGAGAGFALPLLDAMIPASTALAQTPAQSAPRMGFIFFPHGAVMDKWSPAGTGSDFEMPYILSPVADYRDKMTIVSGLRNKPAESSDPHGIVAGTWLRCVNPKAEVDEDSLHGVTADQVAARFLAGDTPFPSLEMATPTGGPCAAGYSCSFGSTLSFTKPRQPLPMENNPRKMFFQMFGQGDNDAERAAIVAESRSLLDSVMDEAKSFKRRLGPQDRSMVDDYLASVRDVELRIQKLQEKDMSHIDVPSAPVGIPSDYEEHLKVMFDLIALSYQANLTNVASFMMEKEVSMRTFPNLNISEAFHPLSHHGNDPAKLEKLANVQHFHTQVFKTFLDKLDNMPEGDGTVLDNSIILYGSNMSNSDKHNQDPLPNAIFGHGRGTIKGGQHLRYAQDTPHANLLLTLLNRAGIDQSSFGDSTGVLSEV